MRITDIKTFIPMVGLRPQCLVKVETDRGIHGWGEAGLSSREEAVAAAVGHFRELVIGADPMARGAIWQRLYRSQYFEGGRVLTAAISAIDIALHDICGKAIECLLCMVNIAKPDATFCSGDCDLPIQLDGPFAGFKVIYL